MEAGKEATAEAFVLAPPLALLLVADPPLPPIANVPLELLISAAAAAVDDAVDDAAPPSLPKVGSVTLTTEGMGAKKVAGR